MFGYSVFYFGRQLNVWIICQFMYFKRECLGWCWIIIIVICICEKANLIDWPLKIIENRFENNDHWLIRFPWVFIIIGHQFRKNSFDSLLIILLLLSAKNWILRYWYVFQRPHSARIANINMPHNGKKWWLVFPKAVGIQTESTTFSIEKPRKHWIQIAVPYITSFYSL